MTSSRRLLFRWPIVSRVVALIVLAQSPAQAETVNLGLVTWSAFKCFHYARMGKKEESEQARLFDLAMSSGRKLLEGLKDGTIKPDKNKWPAPLGMLLVMQGPSADFILGRIFQDTDQSTYDEIAKGGGIDPPDRWITDEKGQANKAQFLYMQANCSLLR